MGNQEALPQVVVAQLGARQDYTVPMALQRLGYLQRVYTDTYLKGWEARMIQPLSRWCQGGRSLLSRHQPALNDRLVTRFNRLGWRYVRALRRATSSQAEYEAFMDYGQAFNRAILRSGLPEASHLYGFDHAALTLFQACQSQGIQCVLDQIYPALYEEHLEQEEEDRWPGWALAPRTPYLQSVTFQHWRTIQLAEWELATTIVVASRYSYRAISTVAPAMQPKLQIVPLTVNLDAYVPVQRVRTYRRDRPLRLLFVGTVNVRKGIPDLLTAMGSIDPAIAQLTVVGRLQIQADKLQANQDRVIFRGAIPHLQMPQIYQEADLFVFPTISDGFGAVLLEAMATGLPVIATDHCSDLVREGINGIRIPIRQPEAIATAIHQLYQNPEGLTHLSRGAIATAQQFTLSHYQSRLEKVFTPPTP